MDLSCGKRPLYLTPSEPQPLPTLNFLKGTKRKDQITTEIFPNLSLSSFNKINFSNHSFLPEEEALQFVTVNVSLEIVFYKL